MTGRYFLHLWLLIIGTVSGQFPNMFMNNMNTGSSTSNSSGCSTTVSCAPWCGRSVDSNGCAVCHCSSANMNIQGINPSTHGGMNPMSGISGMSGMNPMSGMAGMNPMNPINMFAALSGGSSPMAGNAQTQTDTSGACDPAPRTCPAPQPWCERITRTDGCAKCMCGNELTKYRQELHGQSSSTVTTQSTTDSSTTTPQLSVSVQSARQTTSAHAPTTPSQMMSCLDNFFCSKICDHGYKTDNSDCPMCECIGEFVDSLAVGTDPPGKITHFPTTSPSIDHVTGGTDHVINCPGIFNCDLICETGYKTDLDQCPLCECETV